MAEIQTYFFEEGNAAKNISNKTAPKKLYGIGRFINLDQGVADIVNKLKTWK